MSTLLPPEILEKIIELVDIQTKRTLYEQNLLKSMTHNDFVLEKWKKEVYQYYFEQHKSKLKKSLDCLPFHVWDDGTPIKKHKCI